VISFLYNQGSHEVLFKLCVSVVLPSLLVFRNCPCVAVSIFVILVSLVTPNKYTYIGGGDDE